MNRAREGDEEDSEHEGRVAEEDAADDVKVAAVPKREEHIHTQHGGQRERERERESGMRQC